MSFAFVSDVFVDFLMRALLSHFTLFLCSCFVAPAFVLLVLVSVFVFACVFVLALVLVVVFWCVLFVCVLVFASLFCVSCVAFCVLCPVSCILCLVSCVSRLAFLCVSCVCVSSVLFVLLFALPFTFVFALVCCVRVRVCAHALRSVLCLCSCSCLLSLGMIGKVHTGGQTPYFIVFLPFTPLLSVPGALDLTPHRSRDGRQQRFQGIALDDCLSDGAHFSLKVAYVADHP